MRTIEAAWDQCSKSFLSSHSSRSKSDIRNLPTRLQRVIRCDGATTSTGSHWTKPRSRITETIISVAGPVGTLPARCCFVTARRIADSKDVVMPVPPERPVVEPVSRGFATPKLGPRELLRNRSFLLFQARGTLSNVSYTLYVGTILWLTYRLSGGIFLSGVVIGVQTFVFTLTFLISPLVDRLYDKRWVFVLCYPVQTALALVLALTYAGGVLTISILVAIVVLLSVL